MSAYKPCALVVVLFGLLVGCGRDGAVARNEEAMLVMLGEARVLHKRADLHVMDGNTEAAIADVREVLAIRFPAGSGDGEDTLLDAHARLARLLLQPRGEEAERKALAQLELGRKAATRDSFFSAQLESVAAEVYEARALRLVDPWAQKEARKEAVAALGRAIQIDRQVLRTLLSAQDVGEEH
ncbi:MAG TPA: hypothetical protein PKE31_15390 [Pseudomonadota bacterium]|jgi:hypothetical protein|nr:hypothetical protein [Pseudomonadota bacterium]